MYDDFIDAFNEEDKKRLARMLVVSRDEGGISQEKVALELGIAKKTVQNWERGISAPTLPQVIAWFRVMKVTAMPYLIQFLYPNMENLSRNDDDEKLRKSLLSLIEVLPAEGVRQLMYLLYGDHGSSPRATINLLTAHLQTPLRDRYNHANMIINDYKISRDKQYISRPDHIQPDLDLLDRSLEKCREAIINNKNSYLLNG